MHIAGKSTIYSKLYRQKKFKHLKRFCDNEDTYLPIYKN